MAQIYDNLGFQQLALNQGYESLMFDPDNTSAHRFLSDAYMGVPRREIARVSELLQAQMLQDININPVQPSLSRDESQPRYARRPIQTRATMNTRRYSSATTFNSSARASQGIEDTKAFEGIASALYNRFSLSVGSFRYETDGWRTNAGFQHDIDNLFMQAAITPDFNVQIELRRRQSEQGDLDFNFDPNFFNPDFNRSLDNETGRVGVRYSLSPNSNVLASYIVSDVTQEQTFFPGFEFTVNDRGSQVESQYLYNGEWFNLVAGVASNAASIER